jgi:hypothetical protein
MKGRASLLKGMARELKPEAAKPATKAEGQYARTPGGLARMSVYLQPDEREALRRRAFEERTTESDQVRVALRRHLGLTP